MSDPTSANREAPERLNYGIVTSANDLENLRQELVQKYPDRTLLFRGQNNLYPSVRSGRARPNAHFDPDVEQGWSVVAGQIIGDDGQTPQNIHLRKAVLQHYGFVTHYVDVTSDIQIAAWFAVNEYLSRTMIWAGGPPRRFKQVRYVQRTEGTGYVIVMAVPYDELRREHPRVFNISNLNHLIRPQRQRAWLLYDRPPLLPDPNEFWVATIEIDCRHVLIPFTTQYLFPTTDDDPGYSALLNFPFVQAQSALLRLDEEESSAELREFLFKNHIPYFAVRAIDAPEYVNDFGHGYYDHKWQDSTLFEPAPMQNWFGWNFPLEKHYLGIGGDIANSTKISVSPKAMGILTNEDFQVPLYWPDVGSQELLFTYSQYAYDKVDDLSWPFRGVWLHRDHDLILEHPVTADMDVMRVHAGHAYEFIGGQLIRQDILQACKCGNPGNHDAYVRAMLRVTSMLELEQIVLVPHPMNLPNCYIAL